jgi:hypothetical protein
VHIRKRHLLFRTLCCHLLDSWDQTSGSGYPAHGHLGCCAWWAEQSSRTVLLGPVAHRPGDSVQIRGVQLHVAFRIVLQIGLTDDVFRRNSSNFHLVGFFCFVLFVVCFKYCWNPPPLTPPLPFYIFLVMPARLRSDMYARRPP